jgi:16S rRNA (guanine966-N2)-methyltransferase
MRIIGGIYAGRSFKVPHNLNLRPTTDFAKQGLFNMLVNKFDMSQMQLLDLFSGTGSIALECASREAKHIVAVEINKTCVDFIQNTAKALNAENITCIKANVFNYLYACNRKFDLVIADPPFDSTNFEQLYTKIFDANILNDTATVIIEHPPKISFSAYKHFTQMRAYGNVCFSFFEL